MIISWKHKGLKKFFETGHTSKIIAHHEKRLKFILQRLDASECVEDMNTPSLKLHKLSGVLRGFYSVSVNANWRIIFRFVGKDVHDVNYLDYH